MFWTLSNVKGPFAAQRTKTRNLALVLKLWVRTLFGLHVFKRPICSLWKLGKFRFKYIFIFEYLVNVIPKSRLGLAPWTNSARRWTGLAGAGRGGAGATAPTPGAPGSTTRYLAMQSTYSKELSWFRQWMHLIFLHLYHFYAEEDTFFCLFMIFLQPTSKESKIWGLE